MGIHDELLTFLDAGRVGEAEGCRAVGLHARTAAQLYDGEARWERDRRAEAGGASAFPCSATATSGKPKTRCA